MKKWPLPKIDKGDVPVHLDWNPENWFKEGETNRPLEKIFQDVDLPAGWSNPWPDLPNPDEQHSEIKLEDINLSIPRNRCKKETLLGYYISWHIVGVSFQNQNGRQPRDGEELKSYNDRLPEENRYGIHICCKSIDEYINKFSTEGLESDQIPSYLEYCTFLTLIYVIAHEWGHYRSEVLSFQITNLVKSITGESNNSLSPSFLSYFVHKKQYPSTNFEEVFAEYASLKLGIFNYYMKKPSFANSISNWPQIEATVKFMLSRAISRPSRIRPYSDIRFWIDFDRLTRPTIMRRVSENKPSLNRSINDNVNIEEIKSFKKGKIIDLLMHNQMQFSNSHQFNGIVRSFPLAYPLNPDSLFYNFADDECLDPEDPSNTDRFLQLSNPVYSDPMQRANTKIIKVVNNLKEIGAVKACLPIKLFPEILPLDSVYFHS